MFRVHAIRRMFGRRISREDVRRVLDSDDIIEEYPDDTPYPSALLLGFPGGRPLHVVAADNHIEEETIIITAYEPDPARWDAAFRKRV